MIIVKIGNKTQPRKNTKDEISLLSFIETKSEIDRLNEELKKHKEALCTAAKEELSESDASTVTFQKDDQAVKITFGWDIKIKDEEALREIIGDRFYDLVEEKTTQSPSKKLKEMALDDDGLQSCMIIKEKTPSVAIARAI